MDVSTIKAVVFDCDGVLFDTALANRKFYDELLLAFGKKRLNQEQFVNVHMMTVKAAIEYLFSELEDHTPVYEKMKSVGYAKFIPYMEMEDGLRTLLGDLKDQGLIRAIATNRSNTMDSVLLDNDLANEFEMVVTSADVDHPKPAPDQLNKIMAAYGLLPEEIIFIGDSEYDQKAAQKAGTWFAAFKQPGLTAHVHVRSMKEIAPLLRLNK
ncbi:MAG: HAD family hydrolase [Desulfobacter sp.]|nr:HAD family hydrolase [Desulfobacter sp.]WDP85724.1 MAG: HAD family hydrolase [Desulfobacter sp.]